MSKKLTALALLAGLGGACCWWQWGGTASHTSSSTAPAARVDSAPAPQEATAATLRFVEMRLPFQYERGDSGRALPVEPTGGGVAIADFDGDSQPDLFFAQGVPLASQPSPEASADVLLRNMGDRRFEDVSTPAGLGAVGYGAGVTCGDYDADGFLDAYVTRYGVNTLWRNRGDGSFEDATSLAEVGCAMWSLGSAFADLDGDADLDLFVANYADFNPADAPFARNPSTGEPTYGAPENFAGQPDVLYANDGTGRFEDVTASAGISDTGRGMGVLATDFDRDGLVDVLVANDAQNNALWHNRGGGRFEDVALAWGVGVNAQGLTEANMGIAYGDTDSDGLPDVFMTHLVNEHDTLWRVKSANPGDVTFRDETYAAGLGLASRRFTGWGAAMADFDHDGMLDIIVANGHLRHEQNQPFAYGNPPLLWRNVGQGRFASVGPHAGPHFQASHQARGLAVGDLDGDGDMDAVMVHHYTASVVLWNETPPAGSAVTFRLLGRTSRSPIGARLVCQAASRQFTRTVDGGGSYLSTNDSAIHFGLGETGHVQQLSVVWPLGHTESRHDLVAGETYTIHETDPAAVGNSP